MLSSPPLSSSSPQPSSSPPSAFSPPSSPPSPPICQDNSPHHPHHEDQHQQQHCGYIALMGRTNAGKSTLLNACIGRKLAGVSRKPELTRNRILGIHSTPQAQLLFLDTPGMSSRAHGSLTPNIQQQAYSVVKDADIILYLIDLFAPFDPSTESIVLQKIEQRLDDHTRFQFLLSKRDRVSPALKAQKIPLITSWISSLKDSHPHITNSLCTQKPLLLSAKIPTDVHSLKDQLCHWVPPGAFLYPCHTHTNRSDPFIISELIREQIFRSFSEELPYQTAVHVHIPQASEQQQQQKILPIHATIIVHKNSHKGMLIGKGGSKLQTIRKLSLKAIKQQYPQPIRLQLWVKVDAKWIHSPHKIQQHLFHI